MTAPTDLRSAIPELSRPFTGAAMKFKIQTNPKDRGNGALSQALVVAFMDSRLAAERLNAICPGEWSDHYAPATLPNGIVCHLSVFGAQRCDAGFVDPNKLNTDMGLKGLYSDAFKRAAVKFGIGAFLYALPKMYVKPEQLKHQGNSWYLTPPAETDLRKRYAHWLQAEGIERFGEPLDHGDAEDAQGDPDAEPTVVEPDVPGPPSRVQQGDQRAAEGSPATRPASSWVDATVTEIGRLKIAGRVRPVLRDLGVVPPAGAGLRAVLERLDAQGRLGIELMVNEAALLDAAASELGAKDAA